MNMFKPADKNQQTQEFEIIKMRIKTGTFPPRHNSMREDVAKKIYSDQFTFSPASVRIQQSVNQHSLPLQAY